MDLRSAVVFFVERKEGKHEKEGFYRMSWK